MQIEGKTTEENKRLVHTLHMLPIILPTNTRCFDAGKMMVITPLDDSSPLEFTLCSPDNPDYAGNFRNGTWVELNLVESTDCRTKYAIRKADQLIYDVPYESVQLQWKNHRA